MSFFTDSRLFSPSPAAPAFGPAVSFLLLTVLLIGLLTALLYRGPYIDEFWTMLFADPSRDWQRALEMWSGDTGHPVGYIMMMRLYAELVPQSLVVGRLFNLFALAIFLVVAFLTKGAAERRRFSILFSLTLFSSFFVIERFAEQRSYFSALMLLATIIILIHRTYTPKPGSCVFAGLMAAVVVLALFHYAIFLASVSVLSATVISHIAGSRNKEAFWTGGILLLGLTVMAASLINAFSYVAVPSSYHVSMSAFAKNILIVLAIMLLANPVISFSGIKQFAAFNAPKWIFRRFSYAWLADFPNGLVLAFVLAVVGYSLVNAFTHVLLVRQLMGLAVIGAAILAAFARDASATARWRRWAVLAFLVSFLISLTFVCIQRNFNGPVYRLVDEQEICSDYRVFALFPSDILGSAETNNAAQRQQAISRGYDYVARSTDLVLQSEHAPRKFDGSCGGAVWIQHFYLEASAEPEELLSQLNFQTTSRQSQGATIIAKDGALIIEVPPSP